MGGLYGPGFEVRPGPLFFAWVAILVAAVICTDFSIKNGPSQVALALMVLGFALNIVAIRLNGGRMPVSADVIPLADEPTHRPMDGRTRVRMLGDWIAFRGGLYSPGDVFLVAGPAVLLTWALCCFAAKYAGLSL